MKIVAFIDHQTLGDFLDFHLLAAAAVRAFPDGKLAVIYRNDRPYKNLITRLNPYVTAVHKIPENADAVFPIDWFDGETDIPGRALKDDWYEQGFHQPDMVLTPSMLGVFPAEFDRPPRFRVPDDMTEPMTRSLTGLGLDPKRWFVGLHMREPSYAFREGNPIARDVDPMSYVPMITDIIKNQGGQVVRVGDPEMTPLPEMDGLIDLAMVPDSFPQQVFVASRARYYIGTDSGPVYLPAAFRVPAACTNSGCINLWNPGDVMLTKRKFVLSDGTELTPKEMCEITDGFPIWPEEINPESNTPDELCGVARHLFEETEDCPGWRDQWGDDDPPGPGYLLLPRKRVPRSELSSLVWM